MDTTNVPEPHPPRNRAPDKITTPQQPAGRSCNCDLARALRRIRHKLRQLDAIRFELEGIRGLVDEFAGSYLNAKFPHGRPMDRWGRRGHYS